ncbi:MAG: DivIVA domain-containing protein [Bdellovibrionaceae bacterium]|nr:DivIVA domain-containing protein [Pseudobdellovibrionaceae bacterium]
MRIAPIDIAHKTFNRKVMGLDAEEVMEFLRDVADQMEEIIRERNSLKEALREKELSIAEYRDRDDTLKSTITTAAKMSDQIRQDTEREAKLILQDAHQKADLIVADARDSLKRIYQEISDLKRSRMQFDASLRSLLHAHLAMLDQSHTMIPDPQITVGRPAAAPQAPMNTQAAANMTAHFEGARLPRPTQTLPK